MLKENKNLSTQKLCKCNKTVNFNDFYTDIVLPLRLVFLHQDRVGFLGQKVECLPRASFLLDLSRVVSFDVVTQEPIHPSTDCNDGVGALNKKRKQQLHLFLCDLKSVPCKKLQASQK